VADRARFKVGQNVRHVDAVNSNLRILAFHGHDTHLIDDDENPILLPDGRPTVCPVVFGMANR
jgi:hypothetical protein